MLSRKTNGDQRVERSLQSEWINTRLKLIRFISHTKRILFFVRLLGRDNRAVVVNCYWLLVIRYWVLGIGRLKSSVEFLVYSY